MWADNRRKVRGAAEADVRSFRDKATGWQNTTADKISDQSKQINCTRFRVFLARHLYRTS